MKNFWKRHHEALLPLTIENIRDTLERNPRLYLTVGQLTDECLMRRCKAEHPVDGRLFWFDLIPKQQQYAIVRKALRRLPVECALGAADGREVRSYNWKHDANEAQA